MQSWGSTALFARAVYIRTKGMAGEGSHSEMFPATSRLDPMIILRISLVGKQSALVSRTVLNPPRVFA